jgi:YggT family protein
MSLIILLNTTIKFYIYIIIIWAVMGMLISFNVLNSSQAAIQKIMHILNKLCEPALAPIRRILPPIGGLDLSPIALIFLLVFLSDLLLATAYGRFTLMPLVRLISAVLTLGMYISLIYAILSTLINLKMISGYQPVVQQVMIILRRLCDPAILRLRRYVQTVNGIDIPALILAILFYAADHLLYMLV